MIHRARSRLLAGLSILATLTTLGTAVAGCSDASAPASGTTVPNSAPADAAPAASAAGAPATPADLFPQGSGRDLVLNNCSSCHNLACSAMGQRTNERWDSLKESHSEKVSGADLSVMFDYLKSNFNDSKPEPKIPPTFLEGGCTPF